MKRTIKKLALSRETIGRLDEQRLAEAAGGGKTASCDTNCNSWCQCVSQNSVCITGCLPCGTALGCIGTFAC